MDNLRYFKTQELIDPKLYKILGDEAIKLLNPEALVALINLREFFGAPVTVNNWHIGGSFQYRGYRSLDCKVGAKLSQHRLGNAFDCDIKGYTAEEARQKILANQDHLLLRSITRLEAGTSWVHFDLKPLQRRIHVFKG